MFFLRTCNFGFRSHLFLDQKYFCCQFNLKNTPFPIFQFLRLLPFQMSYMNTKLRFQVGPGPLISPVRQGPCGLNPALIGGFPQVSNSPPTRTIFLFPAVKTTNCHFPTVNLVSYTNKTSNSITKCTVIDTRLSG